MTLGQKTLGLKMNSYGPGDQVELQLLVEEGFFPMPTTVTILKDYGKELVKTGEKDFRVGHRMHLLGDAVDIGLWLFGKSFLIYQKEKNNYVKASMVEK